MKICFGTIFLNEAQYLEKCITQHLPHCDRWVFVEGADKLYPKSRVLERGLSTDGSGDIVQRHAALDDLVQRIEHGWAENKMELRNRYAEVADDYDILIVIDVDEFLSNRSMVMLLQLLESLSGPGAVRVPHVHLWKSLDHIVVGGYWNVPHDRAYRWKPGARYATDHNHPEIDGNLLRRKKLIEIQRNLVPQVDVENGLPGFSHAEPFWLHFGNCKAPEHIKDKNDYYLNRGEARTRKTTTLSRAAWFAETVPNFCEVHNWLGPMPEVFKRVSA